MSFTKREKAAHIVTRSVIAIYVIYAMLLRWVTPLQDKQPLRVFAFYFIGKQNLSGVGVWLLFVGLLVFMLFMYVLLNQLLAARSMFAQACGMLLFGVDFLLFVPWTHSRRVVVRERGAGGHLGGFAGREHPPVPEAGKDAFRAADGGRRAVLRGSSSGVSDVAGGAAWPPRDEDRQRAARRCRQAGGSGLADMQRGDAV